MDPDKIDKIGGSLVNLILGALILWVGQTTFRHAGMLAGIDQKYNAVEAHHENLRIRLDKHITQLNDKTRSRFTREDGDKLRQQVDEVAVLVDALERRITDRVTALQLKVMALETQSHDRAELARVSLEVQRLQSRLKPIYGGERVGVASAPTGYQPAPRLQR